jgi:hypothetical protein
MDKIIKDLISIKDDDKEYKLNFVYKNITYNTTFSKEITYNHSYFRNDIISYNIGFERDKGDCVFLIYVPKDEIFCLDTINTKNKTGENPKCFNPPLPEKGTLDILVNLCISLAYLLNPKFKRFEILDLASIKMKPLSWLKYFRNYSETAYSKYGFILREEELNLTDSIEGVELFNKYMSVLKQFMKEKRLVDLLNEEEIEEILKTPETQETKFLGENNKQTLDFLKYLTLENLIKTLIEDENHRNLYRKIIRNKKIGPMINIQGDYYLSRYYYENLIKPEDKVSNIKIK